MDSFGVSRITYACRPAKPLVNPVYDSDSIAVRDEHGNRALDIKVL